MASANEIATTSNDATLQFTNIAADEANQEVELTKMAQAVRTLAIGVMNPISTQKPHGMSTAALASDTQLEDWVKHKNPWPNAEKPTITRSNNIATADRPFGKVENQIRNV